MIPTMATTVSLSRVRVICLGCEDELPPAVIVTINDLPYCRLCAHDVMRSDIAQMSQELAS